MSGHWFKVVSGACKPKHAPPKSKYIDALVSSTYQSDGSFQDVSQALRSKLRDANSSVVFKSLLVIHTLIRAGNAEEVMSYWSGADGRDGHSLGLKDVASTSDTPQNLCRYANYLLSRFKCYAALKHDPIRTRSEAPASLRHSSRNGANRIRTLTVEKGLLREVATLQKLMDALVDCKFYLEDTDDDLVMSALRLLVKDLLVLFQAVNEGVINVLEHYFEMSQVDATTALRIYKIFCKQCERVVSYLGVAKKLYHIINVNIPNLRHAPVSLAGSLEEYLNDPNFETNREEYRESKRVADGHSTKDSTPKPKLNDLAPPPAPAVQSTAQPTEPQKAFIDFFESIETEQQSMFNPKSLSPSTSYFQQQASVHPFVQPNTALPQSNTIYAQHTGMKPSDAGRASMGQALFGTLNGLQPPQFLQPQLTGFSPGGQIPVQHQMTGSANPFRQSMLNPNDMGSSNRLPSFPTGVNPFFQLNSNPIHSIATDVEIIGSAPWSNQPNRSSGTMSAPPIQATGISSLERFPSPLNSSTSPSATHSSTTTPLKAQVTGSRNPFALLSDVSSTPPVPQLPAAGTLSMNALAASAFSQSMVEQRLREQAAQLQFQQQQQKLLSQNLDKIDETTDSKERLEAEAEARKKKQFQEFFNSQLSKLEGGGKDLETANRKGTDGLFSNVASEFAVTKPKHGSESNLGSGIEAINSQPTGFNPTSSPFNNYGQQLESNNLNNGQFSPIVPQRTGFAGSTIKPFQPSSSFGASLATQLQQKPTGNNPQPTTTTPNSTTKYNPFGNFPQESSNTQSFTGNLFNLNPNTSMSIPSTNSNQDLMGFPSVNNQSGSSNQPQLNTHQLPLSSHHPHQSLISSNPTPSLI